MNNKLLGIAFGGALTLAGLATGCSDSNDTASATESALKGGKKAAAADGGLARCTKASKPKHDGGVKDADDVSDETDEADADEDSDESAGDGGLGRGKGYGGKPADAGGGKPADVGGGKPADVGQDKGDAGHGKSGQAKLNKDKGGKKCLEDDGSVGEEEEDADDGDASTHGQSGEHGKGIDNGKGTKKNADAGA